MKEQEGEDFSRMNRLMSPGSSPSSSFLWGRELLQGKDVRGGLGLRAKCFECQVPEDPGGGQLKLLFSLTISLQLVGKLEEEVLVIDDLELAHVGLSLQVMGGCLHIQAWGTRRERWSGCQPPFFQLEEKGAHWDRHLAGRPLERPNREQRTEKLKEIDV